MRKSTSKILSVVVIPVLLVILMMAMGCQQQKPAEPEGEGAKAPVVIESETPAEVTPTPTETQAEVGPMISKVWTPKSKKDPFVPVVGPPGQELPPPTSAPSPTEEVGVGTDEGKKEDGKKVEVQPLPIETPAKPKITFLSEDQAGVFVRGIVKVGGRYQAILASSSGTSYLVEPGQKLGDWTVASIQEKAVTLKSKGYVAKLLLKTDIGSPGKTVAPAEKETGPKAPDKPSSGGMEGEAPPPPPPGEN